MFELYCVDLSTGLRRGELLRQMKQRTGRRPNLPGQRPAHAPEGAETGGIRENPVPPASPPLLGPGSPERRRRQDLVSYAGPLRRRIYPGYLRPRHRCNADQSRQYCQQLPLRCCPVVSPYGSESGAKEAGKNQHLQKVQKESKTPEKSTDFSGVLARREGFEPPAFWSVARRSIQLS